jgi:hypothetical protein
MMSGEMDWHKYAVSLEMQLVHAVTQNTEQEQRLAEAQEALRIALAQRQDKQAQLTEARALLERWKATVEDEVLLTEEEVSVQHDTMFFLAKK